MDHNPWKLVFQHHTCRKVPAWANPTFFLREPKARCAYMAHATPDGGLATPVTATELPGSTRLRAQVDLWQYVAPGEYRKGGVVLRAAYRNKDTGAVRLYMDIGESFAYKSREYELWSTLLGMLPLSAMTGKAMVYHHKYPEWTDLTLLSLLGHS